MSRPPGSRASLSRRAALVMLGLVTAATATASAGWLYGCSSFSGSDAPTDTTDGGADGNPAQPPADDGATDGGPAADALADGPRQGCAALDASACFDFDHVALATEGWSNFALVEAGVATLATTAYSAPHAARFELPRDASGSPSSFLSHNGAGLPTSVSLRVLIETGATDERGLLVDYNLNSDFGINDVELFYNCVAAGTCFAAAVAYTDADAAAKPVSKTISCGTFTRGAWTSVSLAMERTTIGGSLVTCAVNGVSTPLPTDAFAGDGTTPLWSIGVSNANVGAAGGQVVYFDDIVFR